jgi:hypothetical protein
MPNRDGFAPDPEFDPAKLFRKIRIAKALIFALVALTLLGEHAVSADGLITMRSNLGAEETMKRFEAEVRAKGMMVFAHTPRALLRPACRCGRPIF